eukprot:5195017-Amphidinium_carterae.2
MVLNKCDTNDLAADIFTSAAAIACCLPLLALRVLHSRGEAESSLDRKYPRVPHFGRKRLVPGEPVQGDLFALTLGICVWRLCSRLLSVTQLAFLHIQWLLATTLAGKCQPTQRETTSAATLAELSPGEPAAQHAVTLAAN